VDILGGFIFYGNDEVDVTNISHIKDPGYRHVVDIVLEYFYMIHDHQIFMPSLYFVIIPTYLAWYMMPFPVG